MCSIYYLTKKTKKNTSPLFFLIQQIFLLSYWSYSNLNYFQLLITSLLLFFFLKNTKKEGVGLTYV